MNKIRIAAAGEGLIGTAYATVTMPHKVTTVGAARRGHDDSEGRGFLQCNPEATGGTLLGDMFDGTSEELRAVAKVVY